MAGSKVDSETVRMPIERTVLVPGVDVRPIAVHPASPLARPQLKVILSFFTDTLAITTAVMFAVALAGSSGASRGLYAAGAIFAILALLSLAASKAYKPFDRVRPEREISIVVKVSLFVVLLAPLGTAVVRQHAPLKFWFAVAVIMPLCVLLGRGLLRCAFAALWRRGMAQTSVLIFGHQAAWETEQLLRVQRYRGLKVVGFLDSKTTAECVTGIPKLGSLADTGSVLKRLRPDLAIMPVALSLNGAAESLECCRSFRLPVLTSEGLPLLGEEWYGNHEFLGGTRRREALWLGRSGDRLLQLTLNICVGVVGCCVTLLVLPFVAFAIWLEDGGPVFFRQQYMATPNEKGSYLKFRSMAVDADSMLQKDSRLRRQFEKTFKLKNDPRVTRVGSFLRRYSIDELPEFFSVLRGTLSVVGPRTLSATEAPRYGPALEKVLSVLPGITGFWQVMGRQTTTYEERIQMDLFYLERRSFWLDLFICFKTIWKVIATEGAY